MVSGSLGGKFFLQVSKVFIILQNHIVFANLYAMKTSFIFIYLIFLGTICLQASPINICQKRYLCHSEIISDRVNNNFLLDNIGLPAKTNRLSNNSGDIVLVYDEFLPDSVQISFQAAAKLWESKLPPIQPIFINIQFEPLGDDVSMITETAYLVESELEGCPCSLASQIVGSSYGSIEAPDGIIVLNSDINWNCQFSEDSISEFNLPTAILRGITRCLGFGSSIIEKSSDKFSYNNNYPTYFDKLLYCGNRPLTSVSVESTEMADFVKSDKICAVTETQFHKIYAPNEFIPDVSLCYFDNKSSIMSYYIGSGNIDLSIDDDTVDILRAIGWNLQPSGLSIDCNNISDNGIGSSYESIVLRLWRRITVLPGIIGNSI